MAARAFLASAGRSSALLSGMAARSFAVSTGRVAAASVLSAAARGIAAMFGRFATSGPPQPINPVLEIVAAAERGPLKEADDLTITATNTGPEQG
jgi:hypothetical protein